VNSFIKLSDLRKLKEGLEFAEKRLSSKYEVDADLQNDANFKSQLAKLSQLSEQFSVLYESKNQDRLTHLADVQLVDSKVNEYWYVIKDDADVRKQANRFADCLFNGLSVPKETLHKCMDRLQVDFTSVLECKGVRPYFFGLSGCRIQLKYRTVHMMIQVDKMRRQ
jgi:hypothetical protein